MAMTSETSSVKAYEATPRGLLLRLYPRWSGAMTRKPAEASGSICLRHPYQNSGKPWRRTTAGPFGGPAATARKLTSPFLNERFSKERQHYTRESEARSAGCRRAQFGGVNAEAETREVGLAERHAAGVEIAPDEEQQERDGGVVFVPDGID